LSLKLFEIVLCRIAPISHPSLADLSILRSQRAWPVSGNSAFNHRNLPQRAQLHRSASLRGYLLPLGPPELVQALLCSRGKQDLRVRNGNPESIWDKRTQILRLLKAGPRLGEELGQKNGNYDNPVRNQPRRAQSSRRNHRTRNSKSRSFHKSV